MVDPITLSVKKYPEPELVSGTTIVDLDGGVPLKITEDLSEPGLMLIYDQMGQLKVTSEVTTRRCIASTPTPTSGASKNSARHDDSGLPPEPQIERTKARCRSIGLFSWPASLSCGVHRVISVQTGSP